MGLAVRLTPRALQDLIDLRDYLSLRSPRGAENTRIQIDAVLAHLSEMPLMGSATSEPGIRVVSLVRYPYRVFYTVQPGAIHVVHIRHTSRLPITPSDT